MAETGLLVCSHPARRLMRVSEGVCALHRQARYELEGRGLAELIAVADRSRLDLAIEECVLEGASVFYGTHVRADGTTFRVHHELMRMGAGEIVLSLKTQDSGADRSQRLLRALAEAAGPKSSEAFYSAVADFISQELGVKYVLVGRLSESGTRIQTLMVYADGGRAPDFSFELQNSPSAMVMASGDRFYPGGVQGLFPDDALLADLGAESYAGIRTLGSQGAPLGLVAAMGDTPLGAWEAQRFQEILSLLSDRLALEFEKRSYIAALEESLSEKEALLREVHHRVKNNMAMAAALLALQAGAEGSEVASSILAETRLRLSTMALLHEHLYSAENVASVCTRKYLSSVVNRVGAAYPGTLQVVVDEAPMSIDTLLPLGLITNELVTNALKYSASAGAPARVDVSFRRDVGIARLTVRDYGPSVDLGRLQRSSSLGVRLVRNLARQLGGSVEYAYKKGMVVTVAIEGAA